MKMEVNNNVCRCCLQLVPDVDVELINEVTQKILAVLVIQLDLEVSEDPIKCKVCSGILDEIYKFKSNCLYYEDIISAQFESNIKVSLMDVLRKLESKPDVNIEEDEVVCRLCIKIPPNGSYIALNKTSDAVSQCRYVMHTQLPEINLNNTEEPIICEACHVLLKNYLAFATNCMTVERKIKMYREHQGSDLKEQVDLLCVLQFTENKALDCETSFIGDVVIKQEVSSIHIKVEKVEEVEKDNPSKDNFTGSSSTEFYIKDEEVEIKSEDDQISCDQSTYCPNGKQNLLSHKREQQMSPARVILQCNQCDYHTTNRSSLCLHKKTHDPIIRKFKCEQCEYSTYRRPGLNQHMLTHMELGETVVYYCKTCDFKSKYKSSLTDHLKRCLKEKDGVDSRVMLQCGQCDFHTKCKSSLNYHKKTHDPTKRKFKCEQCDYFAYRKSWLKRHLLTHKQLEETVVYYSATCDFKSKYKKSLVDHLKRCTKEKVTLQCDQCTFCTKCRTSFFSHKKTHDPIKYKFKCQQCEYCTYDRGILNRHLLSHKKLGETVMYRCTMCHFKTKYKNNLTWHLKSCSKSDNNKSPQATEVQNIQSS